MKFKFQNARPGSKSKLYIQLEEDVDDGKGNNNFPSLSISSNCRATPSSLLLHSNTKSIKMRYRYINIT